VSILTPRHLRWLGILAATAAISTPAVAGGDRPERDREHAPATNNPGVEKPTPPDRPSRFGAGLSLGYHSVDLQAASMLGGVLFYSVVDWLRVGAGGYISLGTPELLDAGVCDTKCLDSAKKFGVVAEFHAAPNFVVDPWIGIEGGWLKLKSVGHRTTKYSTDRLSDTDSFYYLRSSFGLDIQAVRGSANFAFGPEFGYIVDPHSGFMIGIRATIGGP
jgi:hypothetical protein